MLKRKMMKNIKPLLYKILIYPKSVSILGAPNKETLLLRSVLVPVLNLEDNVPNELNKGISINK